MALAAGQAEDGATPLQFEDLPQEDMWYLWRGPVTQALDRSWRNCPHLQHFEQFTLFMLPRVQEFHGLIQVYGVCPDNLECAICRQAGLHGRSMTSCFAQDAAAAGGRHHLKKLWSVALSVGPGLWEEAHVDGGAIRYSYLDGSIEVCRGQPPPSVKGADATSSALVQPPASIVERRRKLSSDLTAAAALVGPTSSSASSSQPHSSSAASAVKAATAGLAAAAQHVLDRPLRSPASPLRSCPLVTFTPRSRGISPPAPTSPASRSLTASSSFAGSGELPGNVDLTEADEDGWDSETEERVVLHERPVGLEIVSVADGLGAIIQETGGIALAAGVEVGSTILAVNDTSVEDMATKDIRGMLDKERMPMTLDYKPPVPLSIPSAGKRKKRRRDPIIVCTQNCRGSYRIVTDAIEQNGWSEAATEMSAIASVVWSEHSDALDGLAPVQTVSRLEAFLQLCKKGPFAKSLNLWLHELPEEFEFCPKTWVLPYDTADLRTTMQKSRNATFIAKPSSGAQGKGMILARKWKDLEFVAQKCKDSLARPTPTEYAVQSYIADPLLLGGLKFDMRVFVAVTSVVPLRAYLFKEGLARFCTVPYEPPADNNLKSGCMHLTNYAVNKKSADYEAADITHHDEGSKRSVTSCLNQIEQLYNVSADEIWNKIAGVVANTLAALRPALVEFYVHERPRPLHPLGPKAFQILGVDILIDKDCEPRLLEINANPSLSATQPGPVAEDCALPAIVPAATSSGDAWHVNTTTAIHAGVGAGAPSFLRGLQSASPVSTTASSSSAPSGVAGISSGVGTGSGNASGSTGGSARTASNRRKAGTRTGGLTTTKAKASSSPSIGRPRSSATSLSPAPRLGLLGRSRGSINTSSAPRLPRGCKLAGSPQPGPSRSVSGTHGTARLRRALSRSRSRLSEPPQPEAGMVVSELDLEIKRELVSQTLLLTRPAPRNKTARLRKTWAPRDGKDYLPLDENGAWTLPDRPARTEQQRPDAPERCPAFMQLDFEELATPRCWEYAQAHLLLYRWWVKACGQGKQSMGQEKIMRLFERKGLVGAGEGTLFRDRVSAQLWLSKIFRDMSDGSFGLNIPQFIELAGKIGRMLLGFDADDVDGISHISGVLAYMSHGLCSD